MEDFPFLKAAAGASVVALAFVVYLVRYVLSKPEGNETMSRLSKMIQEGALAFLIREYQYVSIFVIVIFALLAGIGHSRRHYPAEHQLRHTRSRVRNQRCGQRSAGAKC